MGGMDGWSEGERREGGKKKINVYVDERLNEHVHVHG